MRELLKGWKVWRECRQDYIGSSKFDSCLRATGESLVNLVAQF